MDALINNKNSKEKISTWSKIFPNLLSNNYELEKK